MMSSVSTVDDNLSIRQSTVDDEQREIYNQRFSRTILQDICTIKRESSLFPAAIPTINRSFDTTVHSEPFLKQSWFFPVARSRQNTTSQKQPSRQITTSLTTGYVEKRTSLHIIAHNMPTVFPWGHLWIKSLRTWTYVFFSWYIGH
jgi:hypothetical protein